jgi:uracil-DNA glycosylase
MKRITAYFAPPKPTDEGNLPNIKRIKCTEDQENLGSSEELHCNIKPQLVCPDPRFSLEYSTMHSSWLSALKTEFTKPYFGQLKSFLEKEKAARHIIFPPESDIYSWSRLTPVDRVKVVILGQDPYHNVGQAHGLCFSVRYGIAPPPSLLHIYKELVQDLGSDQFCIPKHGCLEGWARQGVLLLNAILTVGANQASSHKNQGWEVFTDAVIYYLNIYHENLVFMLWGSYAQKKGSQIDRKRHLVLTSAHPSPLSVHKGFFGNNHFSKANAYLKEHGKKPIDWNCLKDDCHNMNHETTIPL